MKSAGAIFPNRSPSDLPFVGRDHPLNPRAKRKRGREGETTKEEIVITNQNRRRFGHRVSLAIVCLCVSVFLFATYPYVDGPFCRFVGHVRNVNYQNATRNDRQIELVGTCWYPACERKNTARARERRIRQRWIDEWKLRK